MTLIDDELSVVRYDVGHLALPDQALNERDVDLTGRLPLTTSDDANALRIDVEKRR